MLILEENFRRHLEAFASELFILKTTLKRKTGDRKHQTDMLITVFLTQIAHVLLQDVC